MKVTNNITELIGNTPIVRIDKLTGKNDITVLLKAEKYLNENEVEWVQETYKNQKKRGYRGCPGYYELRKIIGEMGGYADFSRSSGYFDVLFVPFIEGALSIERPALDLKSGRVRVPYRVKFIGPEIKRLEDNALDFVKNLMEQAHTLSKQMVKVGKGNANL